ncbi:S8 family peptidase [Streptomyces sp. GC420]|uniref:S8 family peptidase n=1 Tax=Streptomyces sp. GC420 TaxID=2697568 RepID=UPI0014150199|nr:S8 family peptidase [Streptomyces sp. GC420]NBM19420.1 S8 family serine peptidase [Streptomyces sp. GC420]
MSRARFATVSTAVAVALAAGMTASPSVAADRSASLAASPAASQLQQGKVKHWVTLITGDRVGVDAKGRPVTIDHAEGRAGIPVKVQRVDGHSYVVPMDAQRLIAQGRLDKRLFDVTTLSRAEYRRAQRAGLKLIIDYKGSAAGAKRAVRAAGDTEVRRTFPQLGAEAVTTPKDDAPDIWEALTDDPAGSDFRTPASGVGKVWLDGVRRASLDKSVKQIGADKAWAAGYDGTGVKIAVLDTGVDQTHPDLAGQEIAEKNFSASTNTKDGVGHGTHVASISAGTGVKSGGKYKGVAPGAKILDGKVLDDSGYGDDSGILAGMEWAAAEGADIVNLSLGGYDTPETDPLEEAVNRLSAEKGILFAIAAGNEGEMGPGSVASPGSAEAALTVGAVDDADKLADFSSIGPRTGDSAIKPDVTAPGVDITAAAAPGSLIEQEVGQRPEGYLTISGTSMATPHVAGAAALLKQQHPDWKGERLKAVLTGSAKGGTYTPFEQGSGRVDLTRAIKQTVFAEGPVSLSFGRTEWPHTDDTPVTKKVVYRNTGAEDVTLDLAVTSTNPSGAAAPAGFFKLSKTKLTVPAGGTAEAELTADTRLGGTKDGFYSAYVTAAGGGQSVRTAAAVEREVESYDVTVKFIGRDGAPAKYNDATFAGITGLAEDRYIGAGDPSGTVKVRIPRGGYVLDTTIAVDPENFHKGVDWIAQPKLSVTRNTTITVDARKAKPVDITVPENGAKTDFASPDYGVDTGGNGAAFGWFLDSYEGFHTAHLGPKITDGSLFQQWVTTFTKGSKTEYDTVVGGTVKELGTGYTKHLKKSELAKLTVGLGASAKNKQGMVMAMGFLPGSFGGSAIGYIQPVPGKRTVYVSTLDKAKWSLDFEQMGEPDEDGFPTTEAMYVLDAKKYKGGESYSKTFNTGVFGPKLDKFNGVFRDGNKISAYVELLADGQGHSGASVYTSGRTTLYRNGTKLREVANPTTGEDEFKVPAGEATYKLTTSVKRSTKVAGVSTRVDAGWTFKSKKVSDETRMPVSTVRFSPELALDSTAKADATVKIPVKVLGEAAKRGNLKSLYVYASYDGGQTWKMLTVKDGKVKVKNPKAGKGISFHAKVTDKKGNKATLSVYNAYLGK